MPPLNAAVLAPMVRKLSRVSPLGRTETEALLGLPHRLATVAPETYLVREGDRAESCVVVLSGFVHRSKLAGDGSRQILSIHLQGDLVDLQNSLLEEADHDVQALTTVELAYVPHRAIMAVAEAHPAVARALWRDTLVDASIFREWILNLGQRDARKRISHLFCELALRQEAAGLCTGPRYAWPMTQIEIGDATGLSVVHVNRTLQSLRSDGLITTDKQSVTIDDWSGLQAAGDFRRAYLHELVPLAA